ncbi:GNAT family N-acetyltransferase [Psychromonas sp. PT13]|uniref:GNAT family N-acetyltransferase n=1 Tax=Psychromonas sp. PT13 TaxID=3439547 RepID=UPI003EC11606
MDIKIDDLSDGEVIALLKEHLADMYKVSPPESVHALDIDALKSDDITFFSGWENDTLMGCVAVKKIDDKHLELKSMRTSSFARKSGIASQLLAHVIKVSRQNGAAFIHLETGTQYYFKPAHYLYQKFGFKECGPFADYQLDPCSQFMMLSLDQ